MKIVGIASLAIVFALYFALPIGFGAYASMQHHSRVGSPPDGFRSLQLTASDGVKLAAWYAPSKNGAAIVLIHGGGSSRDHVRPHARMLAKNGFGVLALDLRGHGESGGRGNAFGWEGNRDVAAAVDYLSRNGGVKAIGGMGLSLGGELLLGTISERPEIKAVVSEGATFRSSGDYLIIPSRRSLARRWSTCLMYASTAFFTGQTPPRTILDSVARAQSASLLLIAAEREGDEILYNQRFLQASGGRAKLWIIPGAGHTGGLKHLPSEYERRVVEFFHAALR